MNLDKGQFHKFHSKPYIIRKIKSKRVRWMRHVERMKYIRNTYKI